MDKRTLLLFVISLLFTLSTSVARENKSNSTWRTYVNNFVEEYFKQNPQSAVINGRHEFDGQLADFSDAGIKSRIDWMKNQRKLTNEFSDNGLSFAESIEKRYLLGVIDEYLFFNETLRSPYRNGSYYAVSLAPSTYLSKNYAPLQDRMKSYVKYLHAMQIAVGQVHADFRNEADISRYEMQITKDVFGGFADFMNTDARNGFASVKNEILWKEFDEATTETVNAINDFVDWLSGKMINASEQFAMGKEKYAKMIKVTDGISMSIEDFKHVAENELQKNYLAFSAACQKLCPDKSTAECFKTLLSQKKEYDPISAAQKQVTMLKKYLEENNIVRIPQYSNLLVVETPKFLRYSAALIPPSLYEKESIGLYYITPPSSSWSESQRLNFLMHEIDLLNTSVHEVWPGHFLQALYANKCESPLTSVFWNYSMIEGWAFYCEEMMYEQGLGNYQPEYEMFLRYGELIRDVRFLASISMHTEGMSINEAEQMFIEKAFLDTITAKNEALRGTYDPQYYGYAYGKILINELRDKWLHKNSTCSLSDFHSKFLSYGNIPIPLIEEAMMKQDD